LSWVVLFMIAILTGIRWFIFNILKYYVSKGRG
jgi:hypothetical protein